MLQCSKTEEAPIMQTQFIDKMNEFSKYASKPFIDLMELNIRTFNELAQNTRSFDEFNKSKKPEDFLSLQAKLSTEMIKSMGDYAQKFSGICIDSLNRFGKMYNDLSSEILEKASQGAVIFKQTTDEASKKADSNFKKMKDIHKNLNK